MRYLVSWILFTFSVPLLADQVVLKNGDIATGQIIKKDGVNLILKTDLMGEVTIKWADITSLKSQNPLYVTLGNGKQVNGTITSQGQDVTVASPAKSETTQIGQVTSIRNNTEQQKYERLVHPRLLDLWAGYVDLGFALARGNARTDTLTTSFNAARVTSNDKTTLTLTQIYANGVVNGVSGNIANAARGGVAYDHNINGRWFWTLLNQDEYDVFQSLNFRFIAGGGIGLHAIKTERTSLDLIGGANYTHESFYGNVVRNQGELNFGDDFTHKVTGVTSITQGFRYYVAPSSGSYRMAFDAGGATTIRKWLSWQVSLSDRFLSDPVFGRKKNDILLTTGLRATFAK